MGVEPPPPKARGGIGVLSPTYINRNIFFKNRKKKFKKKKFQKTIPHFKNPPLNLHQPYKEKNSLALKIFAPYKGPRAPA